MQTHAFEIPGSGGLPIRGDAKLPETGTSLPVVVALHGFKGFRRWGFWAAIAEAVTNAGMAFVGFDTSHNGVGAGGLDFDEESLFEQNTWGQEEADLASVLTAVRSGGVPGTDRIDTTRLGLLGHSRGGGQVIVHAASDPGVRATVALAPTATLFRFPPDILAAGERSGRIPIVNSRTGQTLHVGAAAIAEVSERTDLRDIPASHAARLATPLLVCHGEADPAVATIEGRRLAEAAPEGEFVGFPGADHVLGCRHPWAGSTPDFDRFLSLAIAFFGERLGDG